MAVVANAGLLTASSTVAKVGSSSSGLTSPFTTSIREQVLLQNCGEFSSKTCNFLRQTSRQQVDLSITCAARAGRAEPSAVINERSTAFPSFYTVLGINQNVSLQEIKTAYRQMALRYHPDVCLPAKREECTRMFLQVQEAYDMLSDQERRAEYDSRLICQRNGSSKSYGFACSSRRYHRSRTEDLSASWRSRWLEQLHILEQKKAVNQFSDSWGARMRRTTYAQRGDDNQTPMEDTCKYGTEKSNNQ